jgi:hypothetical protein
LADVDFLCLASDSMQSRLMFNALVHGVQIGAKIAVEKNTGEIDDIFVATRPVFPSPGTQPCSDASRL